MKKYFDFNDEIVEGMDILTTYNYMDLLLKSVKFYHGPVTMQLLPYGGVQSVYGGNLIIYTKSGFICCDEVEYAGKTMKTSEFVDKYDQLVNRVFPN